MAILSYVLFEVPRLFYIIALVVPPSPYRPIFFVPIALGVLHYFRSIQANHSLFDYTYASSVISQLFQASSHILIVDVQRELFVKGQKQPAYHLPLVERIKWAVNLCCSQRCVGWNNEPTNALPPPPPPTVTRTSYLNQEIRALMRDLVVFDAYIMYAKSIPSSAAGGHSITEQGTYWRAITVLIIGLGGSVAIGMPHRVYCILSVYFGISKPQDCVPLFGDFRDAYTLRRFWGRVWHQLLRWPGVSHGRFLAYNILHLKRGSKAAFLVQLYTTFLITAITHAVSEFSLLGYWTYRHAFRFFLLQAVAINVETIVIEQAGQLPIRWPMRSIGYLWVLTWFFYTAPYMLDPPLLGGLAQASPSFGICSTLLRVSRALIL